MPLFTPRLAIAALVAAVAMGFLPPSWPGVPDQLPVGPWDIPGPVVVVVVVLLALGVLDALLAGNPDEIEIEREHPPSIALAVPGKISWRLRNPSAIRRSVAFADQLAPSLRADARGAQLTLPGRGEGTVTTAFHPARRGEFEINELAVRVEGPLGLGMRQRTRTVPGRLRVLPAFRSRDAAELRLTRNRIQELGLRTTKGVGSGTEFDQLRDYNPDDDFRRIDWSATARADRPIVRTYRTEKNQRVICLLDNGRTMAARVDDVPRVEHAMDAALTLATVTTGLGDKFGLVAFDRDVETVLNPSAQRMQVRRVAKAMYRLVPRLVESNYERAFATTVARFRRRAMLVILTDLSPQSIELSLLPALNLVARTHLILVGAVRDPEVVAWAQAAPDDADEAHRKAAAITALSGRERAMGLLRERGVVVVDVPPNTLGTELADRYLEFKSAGRL